MTRGTYHSPPCARHTWVHTEDLGYHFAAFSEESRWAAINSARFFRNPSRNCCGVMFATRCSISVCSHGCSLTVIPAPSMLAPSPQQSESFEPWSVSLGYLPLRVPWRSTSRTSATADRAWRGPDTASYAATFQVRIAAGLATPLVTWLGASRFRLSDSDSESDSADSESPSKLEIGAA